MHRCCKDRATETHQILVFGITQFVVQLRMQFGVKSLSAVVTDAAVQVLTSRQILEQGVTLLSSIA